MNEFLTNEEIDTLLDLFRAEGAAEVVRVAGGEAEGPVVSEVDLLKPNRFSRDQIRSLELVFEGVAKSLAATMAEKLRIDMFVDCVGVEQTRFKTWLNQQTDSSAIYVLKMPPFELPVLVTVTTGMLYGAVDRILGGSGRLQEEREDFTLAEYTVADAFVGPCIDKVCAGMEELAKFTWEVEERFCNPTMAQILPGQDVILAVHFQVSGEFLAGDMRVVIPFGALEPYLHLVEMGPGSAYRMSPGALKETTSKLMQRVPVELSVLLGQTEVPLRQLLQLEVGDVVTLPTRVGEPLVAPVEGRPKFRGQIGRQGTALGFQVTDLVES